MNNFENIQKKLKAFIKKYYTNEIIKGSILFLTFGLLYLIFTLFVEYFLWLKPIARTFLFWIFVLVELGLLVKLIIIPVLKLIGLQKGISLKDASKIIGNHFNEIDDKLLNVLQLKESSLDTDLLVASINQKAKQLKPIPFRNAINFNTNSRYIKYLIIPVLIWLIIYISGNTSVLSQSLDRVVHYKMAYSPPAPFRFVVLNNDLNGIEGKQFLLEVSIEGDLIPENVKINFNGESYYLNRNKIGTFYYEFQSPKNSLEFFLEANGVESIPYNLEIIKTPKIINLQMSLFYPDYTHKEDEVINNTGNAIIPEGTQIDWIISSKDTKEIKFIGINRKEQSLLENSEGDFILKKIIGKTVDYQITTSNEFLENYEKLNYHLQVIRDEKPKIVIKSDIDSISRGLVQFVGQLSDDYGLSKLQIIVKSLSTNSESILSLEIGKSNFEEFYYVFPKGIDLKEGVGYEIYFEVFDNDKVNGRKKSKSQTFYYRSKTAQEVNEELLLEQKQTIENLQESNNVSDEILKSLENLSKKLKSKKETNWNDKKEMQEFFKRQKKYNAILEKNTEKLLDNLKEMDDENNQSLEDKKESLKKRIEEIKELQEKENLLKELEELANKLKSENLLEKVDKLKEQTKQKNKSLERILELTKRFYVEKKSLQIMNKLDDLSKKQDSLSNSNENNSEKQNELNKKFDSIKKDFRNLNEQNDGLKSPMDLNDSKKDEELIEKDMLNAEKDLKAEEETDSNKKEDMENSNAVKSQKSASKRMKELSKKMESSMMQMEAEGSEENIKDLQQILDNLLIFSFDQESLMLSLNGINSKNAEYPKMLKKQKILKTYFEHIDDSLYTLSLRMVRISSRIQEDLTEIHYNLDKSLDNIAENRIHKGISNQRYTMTSANNLADLLSDMLSNLLNKKQGSGSGKGKKGESISLPNIIKKQEKLIGKLKDGLKPSPKEGGKSKEQLSGELYEIFQEQSRLREELKNYLKGSGNKGTEKSKLISDMEKLENLLLKKGFTKEALNIMKNLDHELLKLEKATFEKNKDNKRKSNANTRDYVIKKILEVKSKPIYFNRDEILIRNDLPLQENYQNMVKEYFEVNN